MWHVRWDEEWWDFIEDEDSNPPPPIAPDVLATFTHVYDLDVPDSYRLPSGLLGGLDALVRRVGGIHLSEDGLLRRPDINAE